MGVVVENGKGMTWLIDDARGASLPSSSGSACVPTKDTL